MALCYCCCLNVAGRFANLTGAGVPNKCKHDMMLPARVLLRSRARSPACIARRVCLCRAPLSSGESCMRTNSFSKRLRRRFVLGRRMRYQRPANVEVAQRCSLSPRPYIGLLIQARNCGSPRGIFRSILRVVVPSCSKIGASDNGLESLPYAELRSWRFQCYWKLCQHLKSASCCRLISTVGSSSWRIVLASIGAGRLCDCTPLRCQNPVSQGSGHSRPSTVGTLNQFSLEEVEPQPR